MKTIESFTVDHLNLFPGIYVSRKDGSDQKVTTFDLRMTAPNREPVMDTPAIHTIEHLGATWLRNSSRADQIVYFGPMGCRTGFYLLMFGDLESEEIYQMILDLCDFILDFEGEIPGARPEQCGNYSEQNLQMAKYYIRKYKDTLIRDKNLIYPGYEKA